MDVLSLTAPLVDKLLKVPGPTVPTVRTAVEIPMDDGVVTRADLYQPHDASGPAPVVLVRSPYGRRGLSGAIFALPYARRGFQVLIQSVRGTFGSGGLFRPFLHEKEDGLATLRWVREQEWCDGRVASCGASYLGHTQWSVAPYADPPLSAVALNITAADITGTFYAGGVPSLRNALSWSQLIGTQESRRSPVNPLATLRLRRGLRQLPLQDADVTVAGAMVPFWRDFTGHPDGDFWDRSDHSEAPLEAMPPVSITTGWWDLFVEEQLRDHERLVAAGVPVRLTVGPWLHGEPAEIKAILAEDLAWLGHHLNGDPLPDRAPVRVALMGAGKDEWLDLPAWPPAYAEEAHFLLPDGGLALSPSAGPASSYTFDPADPTPFAGGPVLTPPGKQADQDKIESRPDVLTFTGPVLPDDVDLVGPVAATMFVSADRPHADVLVRVCDVDELGVSRNIVDGVRRLTPADFGSGEVAELAIALFPTAYRVKAGHRLRVQVAGGAFPRFARHLGDGENFSTGASGVPVTVQVHHDPEHASRVLLPIRHG